MTVAQKFAVSAAMTLFYIWPRAAQMSPDIGKADRRREAFGQGKIRPIYIYLGVCCTTYFVVLE